MSKVKDVVVVGGGIGGLAVANSLLRAGLRVRLFEKAPKFNPTSGAGFGLSPNGQIVLEHLGFGASLSSLVHPFSYWNLQGRHNRSITQPDAPILDQLSQRYGFSLGGCLRARLVEVLSAPLRQHNALTLGTSVTHVEQKGNHNDSIVLQLSTGEHVKTDLLIAADGIHSSIGRQVGLVADTLHAPRYSGENIVFGVMPWEDTQRLPADLPIRPHTLTQVLDRGELVAYYCGEEDASKPTLVWAATYPSQAPPSRSASEWTSDSVSSLQQLLQPMFIPSHPVHTLLQHTSPSRLLHFGLFDRVTLPKWHQGRVVLLGDACHATLPYAGQGANQALEDGVVLTQVLKENDFALDCEPALQKYFSRRYPRTKKVVETARAIGKIMHTDSVLLAHTRDLLLKAFIRSGLFIKVAGKEIIDECPVPYTKKQK